MLRAGNLVTNSNIDSLCETQRLLAPIPCPWHFAVCLYMCLYRVQNCSWWWSNTFRDTSRRRRGSLTAQKRPVRLQRSNPMVPWPSGPITTPQSLMSVVMDRQGAVRRGVSGDRSWEKMRKENISISLFPSVKNNSLFSSICFRDLSKNKFKSLSPLPRTVFLHLLKISFNF